MSANETVTATQLSELRAKLVAIGTAAEVCSIECDDNTAFVDIVSNVHDAVAIVDKIPFNVSEMQAAG